MSSKHMKHIDRWGFDGVYLVGDDVGIVPYG